MCVGGAGAGLTDGPIPRVGGGPRVRGGGGPIPGIETAAVDPGGRHLDLDHVASVFDTPTLTGLHLVFRDRRKEEKSKKRSKTPPKSYSSARRSRSIGRWVPASRRFR